MISSLSLLRVAMLAGLMLSVSAMAQNGKLSKTKTQAIQFIDEHQGELVNWANQIWEFAEPSLQEEKSSKLLVDILRREGFQVQEKVCGIPTVFVATYGTADPVIGLFGEYDADKGASNKIVPRKEPLVEGGYGHGGHHNLLGIGSLGAALAIKDLIKKGKLNCTIRYYGTTAEGMGAKAYLARDGYFDGLNFCLYWHPSPVTAASTKPWDALIDFDIIFSAEKVNVMREAPGKSTTLDALEVMVEAMKKIRGEMSPLARLNYSILQNQSDRNETADTITLAVRIQSARQDDALALFDKVKVAKNQVASRVQVSGRIKVERAMHQFLPNVTATAVVHKNMMLLEPLTYTNEEQQYVKTIQQGLQIPPAEIKDIVFPFKDESEPAAMYGYASDIGDASWIAPETYFVVRTLPSVPMHSWPGTAFSAHAIGHKGTLQAAKILSMTIIDYVEDKGLQQSVRAEFESKRGTYRYQSLLPK